MRRAAQVVLVMAALVLASCGGGESGCGRDTPCGGEIAAGRYRLDSYCVDVTGSVPSPLCQRGVAIQSSKIHASGTYTFNADKTLDIDVTLSTEVVQTIPAECLSSQGVQATCEQVAASLRQSANTMSASCSGTSDCSCRVVTNPQRSRGSGVYSTSGTTFSLGNGLGQSSELQYCATSGSITLITDNTGGTGMAPMGMLAARGTMVLVKE